jgi:hypothetical protein
MSEIKQNEISDKKDLKKIIEDRIKEYELAIKYFKSNDLESQLKKGEEDKQILIDSLKKINSGNSSEVNEKTIPKEITPEYINGYSNDERIKKYFEIITKIINEKQKLQTELENEIKELKKLNKNQILSMKEEIQNDFEKIKNKKIKYDEIINILKEDFQNKWIPAPLYSETKENTEIIKKNEDVPENTLRVIFGKTNYLKHNKKVVIRAFIPDTNYEEIWEQKEAGDWSHIFEWLFDEKEYNDISEKTLEFVVNEKLKNKDKLKAKGKIPLSKLKEKNDFKEDFQFELETKRTNPYVKIEIKVRQCQIPITENFIKRIFCFTKFYPAFKEEN